MKNVCYMGLDMYLRAEKKYYDFDTVYSDILKILNLEKNEETPGLSIKVNIGYWRKANQIHSWFVKNVQNGVDECQNSPVEREKLQELLDICEEIKENNLLAAKLLPTQSGCFFGGTSYDSYYFSDIENTIKQLKSILNNPKLQNWNFYYQSSW